MNRGKQDENARKRAAYKVKAEVDRRPSTRPAPSPRRIGTMVHEQEGKDADERRASEHRARRDLGTGTEHTRREKWNGKG